MLFFLFTSLLPVCGLAVQAGVWLRAKETEISAALCMGLMAQEEGL